MRKIHHLCAEHSSQNPRRPIGIQHWRSFRTSSFPPRSGPTATSTLTARRSCRPASRPGKHLARGYPGLQLQRHHEYPRHPHHDYQPDAKRARRTVGAGRVEARESNDLLSFPRVGAQPACNSFDHLVGAPQDRSRDRQAERRRGFQIDDQLQRCRLLYQQVGGLGAFQDFVDIGRSAPRVLDRAWNLGHQTTAPPFLDHDQAGVALP
jgi:hypothetical protein